MNTREQQVMNAVGLQRPQTGARLVAVGTATPPRTYTQDEILAWSGESNPAVHRLFRNSHIRQRALYLPDAVDGRIPDESSQQLIDKHKAGALDMGPRAIREALDRVGLEPTDIDFLVCVSSTGLLCPGISAHLIQAMGFRSDVQRLDLVGMGCNAAVNGLHAAVAMARSQPERTGLLVCIEVCSAAYVLNPSMSTAVVNSLFGDGAGALVIRSSGNDDWADGPVVVDFEPLIVTEAIEAMKYNLDGSKLSFFLDRDIPFVIGRHVSRPVGALLGRHGLRTQDINHWIIHSGGKKVIDAIAQNLGLSEHQVRHSRGVLEQWGNVSSGSVLFSFKALRAEGVIREGDIGVLIAMGPGTSIETCLLAW
jgi:alkylresorcinol/alkylpyrone synthase/polyketide synthase Type III